ncbi:MAG TPA: hypothetical protein VFM46_09760 [Pseudomonadales bacterium]|nr:hypothetical protein [Pseudomonadales bacterium]
MAEIHIEDFYHDAGMTLLHLYGAFPRKYSVYVEDIIGPSPTDDFGLHSKRHESCFSTMIWLADEGLIRYEALIQREAIDQAVLTQRAFVSLTTLHTAPLFPAASTDPASVVTQKHTIISQLRSAFKQGSSIEKEEIMRYFLAKYSKYPNI